MFQSFIKKKREGERGRGREKKKPTLKYLVISDGTH